LLWCVAAGAGVVAVADADAPLRAALSAALEANERLREELARRDAEIERLSAELAVLQRMVILVVNSGSCGEAEFEACQVAGSLPVQRGASPVGLQPEQVERAGHVDVIEAGSGQAAVGCTATRLLPSWPAGR